MKIIKLVSENIKRLQAVEITPDGTLVVIGGKNGAGKSSVLDSIAYAMGGKELAPPEPIRKGEKAARIEVDLGDLVVVRKFTRDYLHHGDCGVYSEAKCNCGAEKDKQFGPTRSTLIVKTKDGASYPSPQAVLDKLLGKLTFDPLEFSRLAREEPKRANEILRKVVGVDTTPLDKMYKEAYDQRALLKKQYDLRAAQLAGLPLWPDTPPEEVPLDDISKQMADGERLRREADVADRKRMTLDAELQRANEALIRQDQAIKDAEERLTALKKERDRLETWRANAATEVDRATEAAKTAGDAVPNVEALRAKLSDVEAINSKVRANKKYAEAKLEVDSLFADIETQDAIVQKVTARKRDMLTSAKFPVEGLGLNDTGVTFGGLPFEQASASEQLRVSVAIGLALNPKLRVLLIRSGNLLDEDSLKLIAEQAQEAGAQIWMEYVTKTAADTEGVSVLLEDGTVVTQTESV